MGITKTDLFGPETNELATCAKVLGHPARIAILEHLLSINSCINGDLVQELGLAQPTISQHLRELRDAGLIKGNIDGTRVSYCINRENWMHVQNMLNSLFDRLQPIPTEQCC